MNDTHLDFVRQIVADDVNSGKWDGQVVTRFPPEPNGYLHVGHAKSIFLNFGIAEEFGGTCRLRFDDTNPSKEDREYVDAIVEDVEWLIGRKVEVRWASDYFEQMYTWAKGLIEAGLAYVDDQDGEAIRTNRGTVKSAGVDSPFRDRPAAESLQLLEEMRRGEHAEGSRVLRARIDMAHPNMLMRDPLMYRIQHAKHHRTGSDWHIYPLYDWAHGLEDSIEGVTHSICTLEFETHRPLYDWFLDKLGIHHPQQIEFNRLNLDHTVMSKRKLLQLVDEQHVAGWDDPRLPTVRGLRRRGVAPAALRSFCTEVGVTKVDTVNEWALFEHHVRQELNRSSPRAMAVLKPLKVVITNWDEERTETVRVPINPEDPEAGERELPFTRELWVESDDFMMVPEKKFFRLFPGNEVRLRGVGLVRCEEAVTDDSGAVTELRCTIDHSTFGGVNPADGRKVKATLHWISGAHCVSGQVRLYDHLFTSPDPAAEEDWIAGLAQNSCTSLEDCKLPAWVLDLAPFERLQFERLGYFCVDPSSTAETPVFNRTAPLRDPWAKLKKKR